MRAHKVELKDYQVEKVRVVNNKEEKVKEYYEVREILVAIMLHPSQQHKGFRFYTVDKVAKRIVDCKKDHILLDAKDYEVVKECVDNFKGFGRNDAELVRRIYEAEEKEVEEKKKK